MEKDPIDFMRKESFMVSSEELLGGAGDAHRKRPQTVKVKKQRKELIGVNAHQIDQLHGEGSESSDDEVEVGGGAAADLNGMDFIDEVETIFHDAEENFMDESSGPKGNKQRNNRNADLLYQIEESDEEVKGGDDAMKLVARTQQISTVPDMDPPTRDRLPFFKDPKIKFSVWTIIKDSIG